jgi:hypothetical protein
MMNTESGKLLTYVEVAAILNCCVKHLRDAYVKTGMLTFVPLGKRAKRFRVEDVQALIDRLATVSQGASA